MITYKVKAQAALPIVDIITLAATGSEYDAGGLMRRESMKWQSMLRKMRVWKRLGLLF